MIHTVNNPNHLNGKPQTNVPDPEVTPKKTARRKFSAKQKLTILAEIDGLERGQVGAYLRRKGLYSSTVSSWRKQRDQGALDAMTSKKRGAKPKSAEARQLEQLKREHAKLQRELEKANIIIDVQKKLCSLYGVDSMTGEKLT